jgi:two-component system KDP operon response regulator KdpE
MSAAPPKVLIIDDEPPIRKLLRMGLSTQGYEILEAPNGKTSLELLAQKPDLVILDLGLPDMQGLDLLRIIRARNESVPIVVLSSRGDEAGKVQALDLGADDYVTKPFGMDELLAECEQHCGISFKFTVNGRSFGLAIYRSTSSVASSESAKRT